MNGVHSGNAHLIAACHGDARVLLNALEITGKKIDQLKVVVSGAGASAIACALAKTTGRPVTITKDQISPDLQTIDTWYRIIGD